MTLYYLGLGSNQDAETNIRKMLDILQSRFDELLVSSIIRTRAEGSRAADYLNAVVCLRSELTPEQLNYWCKQQEDCLGRVRGSLACRADIDILQAVNQPLEVSVSSVREAFFQPLLEQLVSIQTDDSSYTPPQQAMSIRLATGIELGVKPRFIKTEAVETA